MDGFHAYQAALEDIAGKLRNGSSGLEGTAEPPSAPEVGDCTASVSAVLALLSESIGGAVEGLGTAGDAVAGNSSVYGETDHNETQTFTGFGLN